MRFLLSAISVFLIVSSSGLSQMITTDPAVVTTGKVIKIYYDSSKDPGELHNYSGDLYAHTGVMIEGLSTWQHVIGAWGNNSAQPKLSKVGQNPYLYELVITPDIKAFYGVSASEKVLKIALVFRTQSDPYQQTRPDIFIDVFQTGLNCTFTLPTKSSFVVEKDKQINLSVSATLADSVSLFINKRWIKKGSTADLLTHTITASQYGEYWVKAVAWDLPKTAADSFFFYVRKPIVTEALPAGLADGINYLTDTSAALVLYAPYKGYAFAIGDFNGWTPCEKGYMKVTPDNERYWLEIRGLKPKKEYRFQYQVDSVLRIADPYTDKILDPNNDQYITSATYPGLVSYPKDTTTGVVSVLQTAQVPYSWTTATYAPPQKNKLVIYELLVRDFVAKHNFKTISDTLNYLQKMGVNSIELMPVTEFEGNLSWGYNVSFYFAPDKYYGPKNTLKALVDSCHKRGIAVIMDLVLNHAFGQSPFVQLYLDYYGTDQIVMKSPNPWFNVISPNPVYKWGADFNHESPATQNLVDRVTSYWMTEYKIDGFRFDFSKGFTNTPGDGGSYDAARINILQRMAGKIWQVNPAAYVILEHFAPNSEEKILAEYGMMLWGNMNYQYTEAVMGFTSDLTYATPQSRGWNQPNLVSYMESHDEERVMYKALTYGNSATGYNIREIPTALKRVELAAVFFLTIPGPKMIWQFGELGYDLSIDLNGRTGEKPILWVYTEDIQRQRLYLIFSILNKLKKEQEVFSTSDYTYSLAGKQKSMQLNSASMKVNILGNFDVISGYITPGFQQTGKWYEYFTDDSIAVSSVNDPVLLQAGEYRLYTTKRLKSPKTILGIKDEIAPDQGKFTSVYPNPSADDFNFTIQVSQPSPIVVTVFDLSGRIIWQKRTTAAAPGTEIITWDGRTSSGYEAGKGLYIVEITSGKKRDTLRIIKR
jgi:glycosidase